jgi:hypothetical protein
MDRVFLRRLFQLDVHSFCSRLFDLLNHRINLLLLIIQARLGDLDQFRHAHVSNGRVEEDDIGASGCNALGSRMPS